ncbi:hypothetical protein ABW21_db0201062 [Orbilia brochopaga]|nr:hypothetical protein ABW21_db0201062 [Drechslerella brochopaga]
MPQEDSSARPPAPLDTAPTSLLAGCSSFLQQVLQPKTEETWTPPTVVREYGPFGECGVDFPSIREVIRCCDGTRGRNHLTYEMGRNQTKLHIMYGTYIHWGEVVGQVVAAHGLAEIGSKVMVPKIYHAFEVEHLRVQGLGVYPWYKIYVIMDHIDGQALTGIDPNLGYCTGWLPGEVARAIVDLAHVPLAAGLRPSAVDGGEIVGQCFGQYDGARYRHYADAKQVEDHINYVSLGVDLSIYPSILFPKSTRSLYMRPHPVSITPGELTRYQVIFRFSRRPKSKERIIGLSKEPLVLCMGGPEPDKFRRDEQGRLWITDFHEVNILPATFVSLSLGTYQFDSQARNEAKECFAEFPVTSNVRAIYSLPVYPRIYEYGLPQFGHGEREIMSRACRSFPLPEPDELDH